MKFNICSNIDNQVGLQKDYEMLKALLESWGHEVRGVHYRKQNQIEEASGVDANIFLEVVSYDLLARKVSRKNLFIPNPEWFAPWDHKKGLPDFDLVLCKTYDAVEIFKKLTDVAKVRYVGFEARDLYDESIPRERKFLHIAGQSRYKNTMSVTYSFSKMFDDEDVKPQLTIVGAYPDEYAFAVNAKNIKTFERVTDDEMKQLMNSHLFHLLPSGYEGFGHALNEGLGAGSVLLTTNHPPMSGFPGVAQSLLIPYQDVIPEQVAMRARVVAAPVRDMVKKALKMKQEEIDSIRTTARAAFLAQREDFRNNLKAIVEGL
ncbi:MAG: hypothetical protein ACREQ5_12575 [Candidatus Dormibacteria bacterium]